MSYRVRIDSFEGPFDLLLYLVSRQKVDIGAINITQIADQYLAEVSRMENLDLDIASDFLLVASTLLEIKAESLIPRQRDELDSEIEELAPSEARDMLVERLLTYKQYKNAAGALRARFEAEGRMHARPFGPDACFLNLMPDYLAGITLRGLAVICADLDGKRETFLLEAEHVAPHRIPIELTVASVDRVTTARPHMTFRDLLDGDATTEQIVATFLAILELAKRGSLLLEQDENFGTIRIDRVEGAPAYHPDDGSLFDEED